MGVDDGEEEWTKMTRRYRSSEWMARRVSDKEKMENCFHRLSLKTLFGIEIEIKVA